MRYTSFFSDYYTCLKTTDGEHIIILTHKKNTLGLLTSLAEFFHTKAELAFVYQIKDMENAAGKAKLILEIKIN